MDYLIIGDIHGCFYTLMKLLDKNWNSDNEKLIILGDFVYKGKNTFAVLDYLFQLKNNNSCSIIVLKGNNEFNFEQYYQNDISIADKKDFEFYKLDYFEILNWISNLPHHFENKFFYASHAGIPFDSEYPLEEKNLLELFNRKPLKNIQKKQFLGHIVLKEPTYDPRADAWYLDTGAGFGMNLSAIKISSKAEIISIIKVKVDDRDKSI